MSATGKRVLIVTGQKPMAQIPQNSGGTSTLYEVYATTETGETVEEPLRTFAELEEGVAIEYEISRYNHPQYGTSYTLIPPKRNSFKRLRELEEQMELILCWAEHKGFDAVEVAKWVRTEKEREEKKRKGEEAKAQRAAEVEQMEPVPAPENPELDEKWGREAPWTDADLDLTPPAEGGENGGDDGAA
jgi:hypothetical protein